MCSVTAGLALLVSCSGKVLSFPDASKDASNDASNDAGAHRDAGAMADASGPPRDAASIGEASVLQGHLHATRDGAYVDPKVTRAAAAGLKLDAAFYASYVGQTYAQPLYVQGFRPGQDAVLLATQANEVAAFDSKTGKTLWSNVLGPPVPPSTQPCHQPPSQPYGILSTPVIDAATRTLYTEAFLTPDSGITKEHFVYALSIDDGTLRPGWPVNINATVPGFVPSLQHQRGSLLLLDGTLYVPFSGIAFDCLLSDAAATTYYRGIVVGIRTTDPSVVTTWSTTANKGGIWTGLASDGTSVFFATGNTAAGTTNWGGGEAVLRLPQSLIFSGETKDYFYPSNWQTLDDNDSDLGSSTATLFDLPGVGSGQFVVAMGKFGTVHLLDRTNLGGRGTGNGVRGEGLYSARITQLAGGQPGAIQGNPAVYTSTQGTYIVARVDGHGACGDAGAGDLVAMKVNPTSPPSFSIAWCAESNGLGSPMVTTSDGRANPLVWVVSARGTNQLLGFDGDTGEIVFGGGGVTMGEVLPWTSAIDVEGRFYVGATNRIYAFDVP
jgi:hypothetical protein